jgi:hypothetical protein
MPMAAVRDDVEGGGGGRATQPETLPGPSGGCGGGRASSPEMLPALSGGGGGRASSPQTVPASSGGGGRTSLLSRSRGDGVSSVSRSGGASSLCAGGDASDFDRWDGWFARRFGRAVLRVDVPWHWDFIYGGFTSNACRSLSRFRVGEVE